MFDFTGQVVMITGAAGALGQTVVRAFQTTGAHLVLVDVRLDRLQQLFPELMDVGHCLLTGTDLTDAEAVKEMVATAAGKFGRIDVLANIAGGFAMGPRLHETELETWEFMMNLNARTVFLLSREVVPQMLARKQGKIINVGARAALRPSAKMGPYVASKSAVIRLTETMAEELKHDGINVNCILPGTIDTPRNRSDMPDADFDRWVRPEALADVILFLASDAARAIHGAALPVYGRS